MVAENIKKYGITDLIFLLTYILVGGFHEYIGCAVSAALCVYLTVKLFKNKCFYIKKDILALSIALLCLSYAVVCFWAVDRGTAFMGFLKFLPVVLYMACLWQDEKGGEALNCLPYFVAASSLICIILMQFDVGKGFVSVAGRLAGPFQYPNTFSLLLLVSQLLLLKKEKKAVWDYITIAFLTGSLLYTGSRTVFVVFIISNILMLLTSKQKKVRLALVISLGVLALAVIILLLSKNPVLNRYFNISFTESTFVGRILYFIDALPLLLKHPFGLGYLGYFYMQTEIQTGVYSVMFIHNDLLQFMLDVGIIPTALFIFAVGRWFFKKDISISTKIVVGAIFLHGLLDFNMQYVFMFMLVVLLLGAGNREKLITVNKTSAIKIACVILAVCTAYMSIPLSLAHFNQRELSDTLYPFNTQNKLSMLERETDLESALELSEEIIGQNTHHYAPYSIKAKYCYSKGDFTGVIQNKQTALKLKPFAHTEYEEYCRMLINGIALYEQAGMQQSADLCKEQLLATEKDFYKTANRLSSLGKMIDDQPVLQLSEDIQTYIDSLKGE